MVEVTSRLIFLVALITGLAIFLYWDREKVNRHTILFYRRTEKGIELIDKIAEKGGRFWNLYGWAAVFTGILSIVASFGLIAYSFVDMVQSPSPGQGPSLVLPGLVGENQFQAGVSFVPVEYWVIAVAILMVFHEGSHGIVARAEGFELNSVGWIVMGILPGAFVEPKGEQMLPGADGEMDMSGGVWEQGNWISRLKVLGAGSFANYIIAVLFIAGAFLAQSAATVPGDVYYQAEDGFPAAEAGMTNGTLIEVNNRSIETAGDLQEVSDGIEVGDKVSIWTDSGNYTVQAVSRENWDGGYIGIRIEPQTVVKEQFEGYQAGLEWFVSLLWTVGLLNFLIGLFNMLPIKPLDGGLMVETLLQEYMPDRMSWLNHFSMILWLLIIASLVFALTGGL